MKVSKRFAGILFSLMMAGSMAFVMSFALTGINTGFADSGFWLRWMRAFLIGFSVAFPTATLLTPLVRRIVASLAE